MEKLRKATDILVRIIEAAKRVDLLNIFVQFVAFPIGLTWLIETADFAYGWAAFGLAVCVLSSIHWAIRKFKPKK